MNLEDVIKIDGNLDKDSMVELFKSFSKKRDLYDYFNVSRSSRNINYAKELFKSLGLDYDSLYKKERVCLNCGKILKSSQVKFCSRSCSSSFNNKARAKNAKFCPNCHSLTENFGSRNKNSTRVDKRKR